MLTFKLFTESLFNPDKIMNNILYHGTIPENASKIKRFGFDPSKSKYDGEINFTRNYMEAAKYAKIANGGKIGTVLVVHYSNLDPKHMRITKDEPGIVRYKAPIPKEHVRQFL